MGGGASERAEVGDKKEGLWNMRQKNFLNAVLNCE